MFNLKHLKLQSSKAMLRAFLAIVVVLCMLVLALPADLGVLLVGAAANKWDGTLEAFENYSESYSQFADGKTAYKIANAKQLAFLAAVLNATPTRSYFGPCKVTLDMNGDGTAETTYSFPGTGTISKDATTILVGAKFELTDDIDLNGVQWTPIGSSSLPFRATFEGNGHIISGLSYIDETTPSGSSAGIGLFGKTGSTAVINNLHVEGTVKTYQSNMGGIVGYSAGALQMENCSFSGTVQGGGWAYLANTGGLIGHATSNSAVTIKNCFVHGEGTAITGVTASGDGVAASYNPEVGGFVGLVTNGCDMTITDSYAECTVSGMNGSGGLVGTIQSHSSLTTVLIERCYTAGSIISTSYVGGLVGWVRDTSSTADTAKLNLTIKDSYSVMDLTNATSSRAGGLISCSRPESVAAEDVTISLLGCHFAGLNAKQPVMYYDDAHSTLETVERVYYRAGSTTAKTHTLQSHSGIEEKSRKAFMDGQVTTSLNADRDVWATSMWAEYPVLGKEEKPSLSALIVNGEEISLIDGVFEYTATDVEKSKESVLVSATAAQEGATVTVSGADASGAVALGIPGTTKTISVTVTYKSVLSTTYTVNIYRKPNVWNGSIAEGYAGGDGTQGNPYTIQTGAQLAFLAQQVNNGTNYAKTYFKLTSDIDLGSIAWTPIGNTSGTPFNGTLDGDGYAITNLKVATNAQAGLFGFAAATIKNLSLAGDVSTTASNGTAGFVAYVSVSGSMTISNCVFTGTVTSTSTTEYVSIGAFVGHNWNSTIKLDNCVAMNTTINGSKNAVGGLVGIAISGTDLTITNSSFSGSVTGGRGTGGLVGGIYYGNGSTNPTDVTITNSYSEGTVTSTAVSGGLVGFFNNQNNNNKPIKLTIKDCYSTALLATDKTSGGLVGSNHGWQDYPSKITVSITGSYFAGKAKYPILNSSVDTTNKTDLTPMTVTLNNVYYREGSATTATPTIGNLSPELTVQKTAGEFGDGTVTVILNNSLTTPIWATSTAGYPVLSDLASISNGDLGVLGTSIRTEGIQAIRFKFSVTDTLIELNELQKVGVLAAKASDKIVGEHLYAHTIAKDAANYYKYIDAIAYTKGGNKLALIDDGTKFLFTAALYNLTEAKHGIDYIARAYATFVDAKGQQIILYSEAVGDEYFNSVNDVVSGFFDYPSPRGISMSDLLYLKNIYDNQFAEDEVLPPDADVRADGDNPQAGGADAEADALRDKILNAEDVDPEDYNTVYYISPSGNDANDGTSPETAWKNVDAINLHNHQIQAGDAVLFERGGVYRSVTSLLAEPIPEGVQSTDAQQIIYTKSGVTYGAYGEGEKPAIYSCHKNYAWGNLWRKSDKGENIWEVYTPRSDAGSVVFNHGEAAGIKRFGVWTGEYQSNGQKVFDGFITPDNVGENLTQNFEYYHDHRNGVLYLYLEGGIAPHDLYEDIEICPRDGVFKIKTGIEDVHIDNLAIKYTGFYGIRGDEGTTGVTVTNCEMGWIGGCQWHFDKYGEGSRIGNAIEFWETTTDARTENNWIYQVYDAGLSPQGVSSDGVSVYTNLVMRENLVEYCSYGIEWFDRNGTDVGKDHDSQWNGYYIEDNILRFAGYGFGRQRQDANQAPSNICGWSFVYDNPLNVYIRNNIFDCSEKNTVYWWWSDERTYPDTVISGNTFYEKASASGLTIRYGPNGQQWKATNQATLEEAIKTFDSTPEHVEWLPY